MFNTYRDKKLIHSQPTRAYSSLDHRPAPLFRFLILLAADDDKMVVVEPKAPCTQGEVHTLLRLGIPESRLSFKVLRKVAGLLDLPRGMHT